MKTAPLLLFVIALVSRAGAQSTIDPVQPFAWGANIGWTNWRPSAADGVVLGEYVCSGFVWAANVGWLQLGDGTPANGIRYGNTSAADYGVNVMSDGALRGFAWGANIGWINFEAVGNPRINFVTGKLEGHAWSANTGWIVLNDAAANFVRTTQLAPGADSDGDTITDAWELERAGNLAVLSLGGDADGDGFKDPAEYLADTSPFDPADRLRITSFAVTSGTTQISLTWTSRTTRRYFIEARLALDSGAWAEIGLGALAGTGGFQTQAFAQSAAARRFFRIRAARYLAP